MLYVEIQNGVLDSMKSLFLRTHPEKRNIEKEYVQAPKCPSENTLKIYEKSNRIRII